MPFNCDRETSIRLFGRSGNPYRNGGTNCRPVRQTLPPSVDPSQKAACPATLPGVVRCGRVHAHASIHRADPARRTRPLAGRQPPDDPRAARRRILAAFPGLCRPRLSGRSRLYGPRQLGDRHRRWLRLRLCPAIGRAAVEPDGDRAAGAVGATRHRRGARPGAGVPRALFATGRDRLVAALRDRDHRLRPGGGAGHGHRAQAAVRPAAGLGRAGDGGGRVPGAGAATLRASASWRRSSSRCSASSPAVPSTN